ncbi:hypothetical protein [Streptomyces sp. NPDC090022]|uniref:hypothetical protein n=1 Tax=Streptomyces sp. NPDC090022 TaxID=3365920 RepID=UPI00382E6E9B
MTELIGTQRPARRILDPHEALATLEQAVPGLVHHRRPAPAAYDWAAAEDVLGTALPTDFKTLAAWYPAVELDAFLTIASPDPGEEGAWARCQREERAWWDSDEATDLRPPELPRGSLLYWGNSAEGDRFLWSTVPGDPQRWPVTVCSRNDAWWHYDGGMVQFLAELCDGTLDPWALPPVRPVVTHWIDDTGRARPVPEGAA